MRICIGHNTAEIVGPETKEMITIREKFYNGLVLVLDSSVVRAPTHKAGDSGSSPCPGMNFSLSILKLANWQPYHLEN